MKALGGREAKRNVPPAPASRLNVRFAHVSLRRNFVFVRSRPGGMKAGYAQSDEAGHLAVAPVAHEGAEALESQGIDGPLGIRLAVLEGLDQAVVEHEIDGAGQLIGRGITRAEPQCKVCKVEATQYCALIETLQGGVQPGSQPLVFRVCHAFFPVS